MLIGLYFGTFNPIHVGHLIIANHMVENSDMNQVWFVVSPHSPFKKKNSLLNDYHRFDIVQRAIKNYTNLRVSDIEFKMPQPSYTYKTVAMLKEKYPEHEFALIMGEDNLATLHRWKNSEILLENHKIFVYPRPASDIAKVTNHKNIEVIDAPLMDISATNIRKAIKEGKNIRPLLPEGIWEFIDTENFYK